MEVSALSSCSSFHLTLLPSAHRDSDHKLRASHLTIDEARICALAVHLPKGLVFLLGVAVSPGPTTTAGQQ
eukprot:756160-Hanusia_phi.AAC.2